ncbi:MAG TPA: SMP-30/gluconolactonase/LRE family protein [Candidatus Acidoferrales bacterium]|nr:SMP-30/gluconolactonase/LRE family protein [Candidatus Acidoferrales bacterium]
MLDTDREAPGFERIVPKDSRLERIPCDCIFGEGPVWNARKGYLLWTDIAGDKILKWTPGEGVSTFLHPSGHANGMTYDREGRLVVAGYGSRTIWRMEHDGRIVILASHYQGKKISTPNDIVVRSDGSIYWTDSFGALSHPWFAGDDVQRYLDFCPVFRLLPDGSGPEVVADDFESNNGLAFSPDESLLYVNDTRRRDIRVYDVERDGSLKNGRLFYQMEKEGSGPDGMKVDIEGNVYARGPGGIHVIDPRGNLLGRIKLNDFSNMAWGDADWKTLYVTGHAEVYRMRLGIAGVPV